MIPEKYNEVLNEIMQAFQAEWQPISTAPKDGTQILCFGKQQLSRKKYTDAIFVAAYEECQPLHWQLKLGEEYGGYEDLELNPTHWMPLPAPPQNENATQ